MKKFVVVLCCIFLGSSALASSYCPTPEEYRAYLRNYANKAKNLAMKGGNQSQFAATKKAFENYKPKTAHACLNYLLMFKLQIVVDYRFYI